MRLFDKIHSRLCEPQGPDSQGNYLAWCPYHRDGEAATGRSKPQHERTLSVRPDKGFHCFSCGEKGGLKKLARQLGLEEERRQYQIVSTYDYTDELGNLLFQVVRRVEEDGNKSFVQRKTDGEGHWVYKLDNTRRVLYRLHELVQRQDETVFLCEGEKDAGRLLTAGLLATTNPQGAGKWRSEYNEHLVGRDVVILPDNDDAGRNHARAVASSLEPVARSVKILELPGLDEKGDVSDWLDAGGTPKKLRELAEAAEPFNAFDPGNFDSSLYEANQHGMFWNRSTREDNELIRLCNFTAEISADICVDDGAESRREFEITGIVQEREVKFTVLATRFSSVDWVTEHLGAEAIVFPGQGKRDHVRCAVQVLSHDVERRTVFAHTGWREVDGEWLYLHGDGAIGKDGAVDGVQVDLPVSLGEVRLPAVGGNLKDDARESLRLLDVAPRTITLPLLAATYRAPLGGVDFAVHVSGPSGAGKTELTALCQQHFGAGMNARKLPGSWSSTANALEATCFAAKDALIVVDDFCPQGTTYDVARLHSAADRLLRAQGNAAGRGRMRADGSLKQAKPPRGLILSTGEDIPRGHSLRARMVVVEVGPHDLRWEALSSRQKAAADGVYTRVMAGYVKWIAGRRENLMAELQARTQSLRSDGLEDIDGHRRSLGNFASLQAAWEVFLEFCRGCGALSADETQHLLEVARSTLCGLSSEQSLHQASEEPAERFVDLLSAAVSSGKAHVLAAEGGRPEDPAAWGWRPIDGGNFQQDWRPQGDQVGWVGEQGNLYLQPDIAYSCVNNLALKLGNPLGVGSKVLQRRLKEKHILTRWNKGRTTIRVTLQGRDRRVLQLKAEAVNPHAREPGVGVGQAEWVEGIV